MSAAVEPKRGRLVGDGRSAESVPTIASHGSGEGRLLTAAEVADRWSVGKSQVWRLAREGHVPVVRVGRYMRFRADALTEWERNGGVPAA